MLKIWIQDLREFDIDPSEIEQWITKERMEKWKSLRFPQAQKEALSGEYLLNKAFREMKEKNILPDALKEISFPVIYEKNKYGAPYLPGNPLFFNWSHSGDFSMLAVSDVPVGIDIQKRKKYRDSIAKKYYPSNVWEAMRSLEGEEKEKLFFQCWTLLEAWLKGRGCGFYGYEKPVILSGFQGYNSIQPKDANRQSQNKGQNTMKGDQSDGASQNREQEKIGFLSRGELCGSSQERWSYQFVQVEENYEACVAVKKINFPL